jgi:hypothetical protein
VEDAVFLMKIFRRWLTLHPKIVFGVSAIGRVCVSGRRREKGNGDRATREPKPSRSHIWDFH